MSNASRDDRSPSRRPRARVGDAVTEPGERRVPGLFLARIRCFVTQQPIYGVLSWRAMWNARRLATIAAMALTLQQEPHHICGACVVAGGHRRPLLGPCWMRGRRVFVLRL